MSKFYLTTAIAYVNAPPHIGHALEFVQSDALARYHRLKGDDTYFLTGTDEHGVKIYEKAKSEGVIPQELVDKNAGIFQSLKEKLNLSNDDFIRTTQERHKKGAQKLWSALVKSGDIYKDTYRGNYCVGCEAFIPDKDLDAEGNCPNHKKKPEILTEENYFFKLSKYSDRVKEVIKSDRLKIIPDSRKNEMLNIIGETGLHDVSFSRPKDVLPWGVPVPGDDTQVMYVWCDALTNYITAIGYADEDEKFGRYWPCDAHIIGKDILRFHAGIWIGMLISAGIALPKSIYVHGFVTSAGQKMSKSLGNVVDPLEYREKYGVDALRWYLLREIPTTDDGDFSHERFVDIFNSELANGFGNLVNRVTMMTEKYLYGKVPAKSSGEVVSDKLAEFYKSYAEAFNGFDIKKACDTVSALVGFGNKYIDDTKPWAMAKAGDKGLSDVLYNLIEILRAISVLLYPLIPDTASKIAEQIGVKVSDFGVDFKWGMMKEGGAVKKGEVLFPRIEE